MDGLEAEALVRLGAGVTRDLGALFGSILNDIDLLESAVGDDQPRAPGWIADIRAAAERGAAFSSRLRALTELEPQPASPNDLNGLIVGLLDLLRSVLGPRATLRLALEPGLGLALIDPGQAELLLITLVGKAAEGLPEGGVLTLETRACRLGEANTLALTITRTESDNRSETSLTYFPVAAANDDDPRQGYARTESATGPAAGVTHPPAL